ncbi:MAG: hypothetical protein KGQ94_13645 [Alphaproteobacteria bacterium]|nr:hypothetical protein [Alphaproteobacteria bacterium]
MHGDADARSAVRARRGFAFAYPVFIFVLQAMRGKTSLDGAAVALERPFRSRRANRFTRRK